MNIYILNTHVSSSLENADKMRPKERQGTQIITTIIAVTLSECLLCARNASKHCTSDRLFKLYKNHVKKLYFCPYFPEEKTEPVMIK